MAVNYFRYCLSHAKAEIANLTDFSKYEHLSCPPCSQIGILYLAVKSQLVDILE